MNIFILLAIIAVNIIGILIIYQFIRKLPRKEKLIFVAVSIAIHYMIVSVVYWFATVITGIKLTQQIGDFIIFVFVPVNSILTIPFLANAYQKVKEKKLKQDKFRNRILVTIVIFLFVLFAEFQYFKGYQQKMYHYIEENKQNNEITNSITNTTETNTTNTIQGNEQTNITNSNKQSNQINSIANTIQSNTIANQTR